MCESEPQRVVHHKSHVVDSTATVGCNRRGRSLRTLALMTVATLLQSNDMLAENRFALQPSVAITGVTDDNLFFTPEAAASDRILRIRPALEVLFASPRLSASGGYEFDNDRYATHSTLSNRRARQHAAATMQYHISPRLDVGIDGGFTDTDTPAEFNIATGLGSLRRRAQQTTFRRSGHLRLTPLLSIRA